MERRSFILWLCAAASAQVPARVLAGDDDDSGRGRGRGRGGDDDGGDNSGPGGGGDDDRDDDRDDDDDDRDDDRDDDDGDKDDDDDDDDDGDGDDNTAASRASGKAGTGTRASNKGWKAEVDPDTVVIRYADGSTERLKGGRYQRTDGTGRLVDNRPATRSDRARMVGLRPDGRRELVIRIDSRKDEVETVDRRGWRELIAHGTYLLTDPNGNVVKRRAVRQSDFGRIRQLAGN
jgi:hypothetical protein